MGRAQQLNILYNKIESKNLRELPQTGKTPNRYIDYAKKALMPGKRISGTGKIYWETRKNRSDAKGGRL
jgi:hypothetical protein